MQSGSRSRNSDRTDSAWVTIGSYSTSRGTKSSCFGLGTDERSTGGADPSRAFRRNPYESRNPQSLRGRGPSLRAGEPSGPEAGPAPEIRNESHSAFRSYPRTLVPSYAFAFKRPSFPASQRLSDASFRNPKLKDAPFPRFPWSVVRGQWSVGRGPVVRGHDFAIRIPHSGTLWVFRIWVWIPHSPFRIPHWDDFAFRIPQSAFGKANYQSLTPQTFRIPH